MRVTASHLVGCGLLVLGALASARPARAVESPSLAAGESPRESLAVRADSLASPAPSGRRGKTAAGSRFRVLSFTPHRLDRCRYFMILEAGGSRVAIDTQDMGDQFIVSHALGVMKNLDPNWAVGAAIEAHWSWGFVKFTPAVRARRWFGREQSVEGSFGYVASRNVRDYGGEMTGPIASLRYSPTPVVFAEAGISGFRQHDVFYVPETGLVIQSTHDYSKVFGGVGFAAGYSLVVLGGELVVLAILAAMFAGMS